MGVSAARATPAPLATSAQPAAPHAMTPSQVRWERRLASCLGTPSRGDATHGNGPSDPASPFSAVPSPQSESRGSQAASETRSISQSALTSRWGTPWAACLSSALSTLRSIRLSQDAACRVSPGPGPAHLHRNPRGVRLRMTGGQRGVPSASSCCRLPSFPPRQLPQRGGASCPARAHGPLPAGPPEKLASPSSSQLPTPPTFFFLT